MAVVEVIHWIMGTPGTVLLFVVSFLTVVYWIRKPKNLPPGPPTICLPILALRTYRTGKEPHELLTQLGYKYGKMYSFDLMGVNIIVVNDYKLLKEAFQNVNLNDRGSNEFAKRVLGTSEIKMKTFQPYRKFAMTTLRSYGVGNSNFEKLVSTEVGALIEQLKKINGKTYPKELFHAATTNLICAVVSGKRYEYTDEQFSHVLTMIDKWNDNLKPGLFELFIPIINHIPTKAKQELQDCADVIVPFVEQIVAEHQQEYNPDHLKDYIDAFLHQQRAQSESEVTLEDTSWLTDKNMKGHLYGLFIAGGDTTSAVLCWCLAYLTTRPEIQENIHHELDMVIGRDHLPRLSDKDNLPLTRAFILEVLRVSAILPLGIAHVAAESVTVGGYNIPKGSTVIPNIWAIHRDPAVWKDPDNFQPERFLDETGHVCERKEMIAFNVGRRSCPGEAFAKTTLFIFVTHLLHQFSFAVPEGSPKPSLKGTLGIVHKPRPFQVELLQRY